MDNSLFHRPKSRNLGKKFEVWENDIIFAAQYASVDSVGNYAFEGCLGLRELHCQNPVPPVVGDEDVFYAVENCTLCVPIGSKPFYAEAPGWNEFSDFVEEEPQSLTSVPESSASISVSYSVDGKLMLDDAPGLRIARGSKVIKY